MSELTDRLDKIGDLYGGSLIQTIDDAIMDASTCIKRLQAELAEIKSEEEIHNTILQAENAKLREMLKPHYTDRRIDEELAALEGEE